jgi:tRNA splicing ligase
MTFYKHKVNAICSEFMTSSDKHVEVFDDNCIGYDCRLLFHKNVLRQLLNCLYPIHF